MASFRCKLKLFKNLGRRLCATVAGVYLLGFQTLFAGEFNLPSVKRLGIVPATSNVKEFRRFSGEGLGGEGGFAALPLTDDQMAGAVTEMVEKASQETGRFLTIVLESPMQAKRSSAITKSYDLDSYLYSYLQFEPDQIKLVMELKLPGQNKDSDQNITFVREELFLATESSEAVIFDGLRSLMGRIVHTLGHDGKVTNFRNDFVTLDFGTERGLAPGSLVVLGIQVAKAVHPVTGEVFRAQPRAFYEAEVVDAQPSSSLARIVAKDETALLYAARTANGGVENNLLAWRKPPEPRSSSLGRKKLSTSDEKFKVTEGTAQSGFNSPSKESLVAKKNVTGRKDMAPYASAAIDSQEDPVGNPALQDFELEASDIQDSATERRRKNRNSRTQESALDQQPEEDVADGDVKQEPTSKSNEEFSGFNLKDVSARSVRLGLGSSFGQLDTDLGPRYTGVPSTVLNKVSAEVLVNLPAHLHGKPSLAYASYAGGDVEGSVFTLALPVVKQFHTLPQGKIYGGAEVEISSGEAKTIRVKKDLSHFDIKALAEMESKFSGLGTGEFLVGLSVLGIFGGHLEGMLGAHVFPSLVAPKELGLFVKAARGPEGWATYEIGASWTLDVHGN